MAKKRKTKKPPAPKRKRKAARAKQLPPHRGPPTGPLDPIDGLG